MQKQRPAKKHSSSRHSRSSREHWIYGRQPVLETLQAGRRSLHEVILPLSTGGEAPEIARIRALAQTRGLTPRQMTRQALDEICDYGNHQGVAVQAGGFPYTDLNQILQAMQDQPEALVLVLDHLEDPQNVGSLLRTADAAGVTAVILPTDRAAGITPAVVRASAGASEHLQIAKAVNLVRALKEMQSMGFWITGLEAGDAAKSYTTLDFKGRVGLVIGSEGYGLSRLVRQTCDFLARLPMYGKVTSLNAGVAGAVVLYEVIRQRKIAALPNMTRT